MAHINANQFSGVRMVRIKGYFHKLPLYLMTRKTFENRVSSAPSEPQMLFEGNTNTFD